MVAFGLLLHAGSFLQAGRVLALGSVENRGCQSGAGHAVAPSLFLFLIFRRASGRSLVMGWVGLRGQITGFACGFGRGEREREERGRSENLRREEARAPRGTRADARRRAGEWPPSSFSTLSLHRPGASQRGRKRGCEGSCICICIHVCVCVLCTDLQPPPGQPTSSSSLQSNLPPNLDIYFAP